MASETISKEELSEIFRRCVQKALEGYCQVAFTKEPKAEQIEIIEYESRMRVFGLEKFNDTCYIALVNLFESPLELEKKETCGVLLIFVHEESAERLFRTVLKGVQGEDEDLIRDSTKKLCLSVLELLKKEI